MFNFLKNTNQNNLMKTPIKIMMSLFGILSFAWGTQAQSYFWNYGSNRTDIYNVANGRVGIGISTPSEKLDVNGSIKLGSGEFVKFGTNDASIQGRDVSGYGKLLILNAGEGTVGTVSIAGNDNFSCYGNTTLMGNVGVGTSNPSSKFTVVGTIETTTGGIKFPDGSVQNSAASSLWSASGTRVYYNSGNVGVGTNSPSEKLEVDGNIKLSGEDFLKFGTTNASIQGRDVSGLGKLLILNAGTGTVGTVSIAGNDNFSCYGNTTLMGNVGVGTNSPSEKLEVDGNIKLSGEDFLKFGANNASIQGRDVSGYGKLLILNAGEGTVGTVSIAGNDNFSCYGNSTLMGNVGIGKSNPSWPLDVAGSGQFGGNIWMDGSNPIEIAHTTNTGLAIDPSRMQVHLEIDNNYILTVDDGAVGIGTTAPSHDLHVVGDINFTGTLYNNGNAVSLGGSGSSAWNEASGDAYRTSGKVGIGTSQPLEDLHVDGTFTIGDGSRFYFKQYSAGHSTLILRSKDNQNRQLYFDPNAQSIGQLKLLFGSSGRGYIRFYDQYDYSVSLQTHRDYAANAVAIQAADVAYPTMQVGNSTQIAGYANPTLLIKSQNPTAREWMKLYHNQSESVLESGVGGFDFQLAGNSTLKIDGSGAVGIGTASPAADLHLGATDAKLYVGQASGGYQTSLSDDHTNARLMLKAAGDDYLSIYGVGNSDAGSIVIESGDNGEEPIIFQQSNQGSPTERMRIHSNGFVGIGNGAPEHELDVTGVIRACQVKVNNLSGWCDYVFEPDYALPTLPEVERFIKTNKHLPDIPSEAEVMEKGISLGDMDAALLKKVEELTLYTIEQQKQIEALKALVKELGN